MRLYEKKYQNMVLMIPRGEWASVCSLFFVRLFPHDPFLGSHTFIYLKIFRRSPEDLVIPNTYIRYNCCLCPDLNSVNENHSHLDSHSHLEKLRQRQSAKVVS